MSGYSGYNNSTGWDENNSPYDTEEPSEEDNLDHCRLHVKNLPKGLNQQGLEMAFSKYGTLTECFVSTDPKKHYGLVRFETPGEAKQAMMKLNHTEPLRLNISIAYKMKKKMDTQDNARRNNYNNNSNNRRTVNNGHVGTDRDRSYSSRYSTQEMAQGDISISHINDLMDHAEEEDEDVELTLQKLRKMLYRQKLNTSKTAAAPTGLGTRCVLPGGRIVVNNDPKANNLDSSGDYDGNYAACGGDTPVNVPALQHERSEACVACGAAASAYCARCEVTPYCGPLCQRRDWARRHSQLCHNLARTQVPPLKVDEPPIAALRRPRSDVSADNDRKKLQPASDNRAPKEQSTRTMRVPQDVRPVHENNRGNNDRRGIQDGRGNQGYNRNQDGNQGFNRNQDGGNQGYNRNQDGGNQGYNRNQDGGNQGYNRNQDGNQGYNRNQDGGNQGYNRNQDGGNQGYNRNQDGGNQGYNRNRQGMNQKPQGRQAYPRNDDADETWDNKKSDAPAAPKVTGYPKAAEPEAKPKTPEVQPKIPEVQPKAIASTSKLPEAAKVESPKMTIKPALTAAATTPTKKVKAAPVVEQKPLVPEKSVIEQTEVGETLICSVENKASDCAASGGVICLVMNERFQEGYMKLCEDYLVACEEDTEEFKPSPGDTFSICDPADGGWYRARLLTPASCALLDAGRLLAVSPAARCRRLARAFRDQPEYCAALDAQIEVGANIQLTVTSISSNGDRLVSIVRVETSEKVGDGVARRWLPVVEYPVTPAVEQPPAIPTVPRPPLKNNSSVVVIDVSEARLIVRDADLAVARQCDMIEQDVAIYGSTATPLTEPPSKGDVIIARYTDNIHYRALCKRTSVKQNKYLLEYIEYGNTEITTLDKLYPCPPQYSLDARPCLTSEATVHGLDLAMSDAARAYLDTVKEQQMIAKLTLPSGEATAPSGSPIVLTLTKNNESVNRKVREMSTPEWKKIEESGGDILDTSILMLSDLQYAPLPLTGGKLQITDGSTLPVGAVSGFPVAASETVAAVLGPLTDRITEYANSEIGSKPYLPRTEELCIAKCEPYTQWFRAVLCELTNGPGSETAEVLYLDYGNLSRVPTSSLRKCLRDFIELPAVAVQAYIADFPKDPTPAQLEKAKAFLSLTSDGEGELEYSRAEMQDPGSYTVYAPALIQAMM